MGLIPEKIIKPVLKNEIIVIDTCRLALCQKSCEKDSKIVDERQRVQLDSDSID